MDVANQALRVLKDAERELKVLIERSLAEKRYGEIARLAELAAGVSALILGGSSPIPIRHDDEELPGAARGKTETVTRGTARDSQSLGEPLRERKQPTDAEAQRADRPAAHSYPYFERETNRLVKVGWSKNDKAVYEHKAPKEAVFAIAAALCRKGKAGAVFRMEDVLPVKDEEGREIPSYQSYLTLAWFRSRDLVERRTKDGYIADEAKFDTKSLNSLWNSLPTRK